MSQHSFLLGLQHLRSRRAKISHGTFRDLILWYKLWLFTNYPGIPPKPSTSDVFFIFIGDSITVIANTSCRMHSKKQLYFLCIVKSQSLTGNCNSFFMARLNIRMSFPLLCVGTCADRQGASGKRTENHIWHNKLLVKRACRLHVRKMCSWLVFCRFLVSF